MIVILPWGDLIENLDVYHDGNLIENAFANVNDVQRFLKLF